MKKIHKNKETSHNNSTSILISVIIALMKFSIVTKVCYRRKNLGKMVLSAIN